MVYGALTIIKSQRIKLLKRYSPLIVLMSLSSIFGFYVVWVQGDIVCLEILGHNLFKLNLINMFYIFPSCLFVIALIQAKVGYKTIKGGYYPPLDSLVFVDSVPRRGVIQLLRGWVLLLLPILLFLFLPKLHQGYIQIDALYEEKANKINCDVDG